MEDRFFDQKQKCRNLWGLIPKYCDASENTAQDFERLLEIYQEDIGPRAAVVPEVQRWVNKWKKMLALFLRVTSRHSVLAMLTFFPNVYILLTILGTLPVSTATSEHSFSTMRRLKTEDRRLEMSEWQDFQCFPYTKTARSTEKKLWMTFLPAVIADYFVL